MAEVYLGLGSNLGNKELNINSAIDLLASKAGIIRKVSSFYESEPWGFDSENTFKNLVLLLGTDLSPLALLNKIKEIEVQMGRVQKAAGFYTDRIIDIDILFYDSLIIHEPDLIIPHPLLTERDFVLLPLIEIAPDLKHPVFGISARIINDNNLRQK